MTAPSDDDATLALARRLVYALGLRPEDDYRLAVLKRVARTLNDDYPEFLRLLLLVACSHDVRARQRLANALDIGLRRNDLPSGRLSSWGAATPESVAAGGTLRASDLTQRFFKAPKRALGPLEYLTVWHHQRTQRDALGRDAFCFALEHLVELINANAAARERYVARLLSESEGNKVEGTYSGTTRQALRRLATAWQSGEPGASVANAAARTEPDSPDPGNAWIIRPL